LLNVFCEFNQQGELTRDNRNAQLQRHA